MRTKPGAMSHRDGASRSRPSPHPDPASSEVTRLRAALERLVSSMTDKAAFQEWTREQIEAMDEARTALAAPAADGLDWDQIGHDMHVHFWPGSVDPRQHNRDANGEPAGDCYKCRRMGDWLRERLHEPSLSPAPAADGLDVEHMRQVHNANCQCGIYPPSREPGERP